MIYKRYALFCFLLLVETILPIGNEKGFSVMSSVMARWRKVEMREKQKQNAF